MALAAAFADSFCKLLGASLIQAGASGYTFEVACAPGSRRVAEAG